MKPICPNCGYVFDHDAPKGRLYKCVKCREFFNVGEESEEIVKPGENSKEPTIRSDAVSGGHDAPAAECVIEPSASEREATEPSISQDSSSPMPQSELHSKPSRSCSVPGVIAGTLVIGIGVMNLCINAHPQLAMRVYMAGAWLFAGILIVFRSFLGPFGLLKFFMTVFGAIIVWYTSPMILSEFLEAQAIGSAGAYGEFCGFLLVVGLGVLLLVFGFKRQKKIK